MEMNKITKFQSSAWIVGGLIVALGAPALPAIAKPREKAVKIDVVLNTLDHELTGAAPYLQLARILPELVDVNVYFALKQDPSSGAYSCVGEGCAEISNPSRGNWTVLKEMELQRSSRGRFQEVAQCFLFDRYGAACSQVFGLDLGRVDRDRFLKLWKSSDSLLKLQVRKTRELDLESEAKFPVVIINGQRYSKNWKYPVLFAYINDRLPRGKKIPGVTLTDVKPVYPPIEGLAIEGTTFGSMRDPKWEGELAQAFPNLSFRSLSVKDPEAQVLLKTLKTGDLPVYLLKASAVESAMEFKKAAEGRIVPAGDHYVLNRQSDVFRYLTDSERNEGNLTLVARSLSIETIQAEKEYLERFPTPEARKRARLQLRFLVFKDKDGNLAAGGGQNELEENMRQALIQKRYPDKLLDYLAARNADANSTFWDVAARKAGVDPRFFEGRREEAEALLRQDMAEAERLKIRVPNVLVWENQVVLGSGTQAWGRLAEAQAGYPARRIQ